MSRQYKRKVKLTIGDGINALIVEDLRVKFEISKDLQGYPNLAKIDIFNLNDDSRAKVKDEFSKVIFNAGYEDNVKQLFLGDIRNVIHSRQGVDFITTIYAADGDTDFQGSFVNTSLSEGVKIKDIVDIVVADFKDVVVGELQGLTGERDKLRGVILSGPSKDILNQYGNDYDFDWSVQDGVFETIGKDEAFNDVTTVSSQFGMLGSPSITELGADVRILLNPSILPNRRIKIESSAPQLALGNLYFRDIKKTLGEGFYKVQKVIHTGDTHGNDWYSDITGRAL